MSAVSPDQLTLAVMTQDDKTITMAQGVGKKLAQRIILELKDKLGASQLELNTAQMAASGTPVRGSKTAEATAALVGLGYSQTEAAAALKGHRRGEPVHRGYHPPGAARSRTAVRRSRT